jgi:hypothetical protein
MGSLDPRFVYKTASVPFWVVGRAEVACPGFKLEFGLDGFDGPPPFTL